MLQLAATRNGLSSSSLKSRACLSSAQVNHYMRQLYEQRLLEYVGGKQTFRTTVKGLHYLESYKRLGAMLGIKVVSTVSIPR